MLFITLLWMCFIIALLAFFIFISWASIYSVENCTQPYACEDGLSVTPSYQTRKTVLFAANICSWVVIILYISGIIISDINIKKK